jgi:hypothetical protein
MVRSERQIIIEQLNILTYAYFNTSVSAIHVMIQLQIGLLQSKYKNLPICASACSLLTFSVICSVLL